MLFIPQDPVFPMPMLHLFWESLPKPLPLIYNRSYYQNVNLNKSLLATNSDIPEFWKILFTYGPWNNLRIGK